MYTYIHTQTYIYIHYLYSWQRAVRQHSPNHLIYKWVWERERERQRERQREREGKSTLLTTIEFFTLSLSLSFSFYSTIWYSRIIIENHIIILLWLNEWVSDWVREWDKLCIIYIVYVREREGKTSRFLFFPFSFSADLRWRGAVIDFQWTFPVPFSCRERKREREKKRERERKREREGIKLNKGIIILI